MKRKQVTALLMTAAMALGMGAFGMTAAADEDIYEVVVEYPTLGSTPEDLQMVEDALNEITEEKIGVHVTFYPVSAFDVTNTTNLMVSSGEKLDLAISIFEGGCMSYVNKGELLELDDLVEEYGQDILAAEGVAMGGGYVDGTLYAVPTEEKMGRVKGFMCRKDLLDKYGIEYDETKVYTAKELGEIFAVVQAGEGGAFHCVAANGSEGGIYPYFDHTDQLGASYASGTLMNYGMDSTEIVNYFATDEFKELSEEIRSWYENGYLSSDCNTTTDSALTQWQTGNYLGIFANAEPDMINSYQQVTSSYFDTDLVCLYTSESAAMTQFYQVTQWMIPITCDNPEKTMEFLNLTYADTDVINILYRGIEGVHYNFVEGSDCEVEFANGYDASNVPYMAVLNVWGDKSKDYVMAPTDASYYDQLKEFNSSIAYESKALGYAFNSESVKTKYAAISDVVTQYSSSLGLGVVDVETALPEFLSSLEAAGINDVIAENQSQFDTWLAAQE